MTRPLFRDDAYLRDAPGCVRALTPEGGILLEASLFYPTGGGQPGDSGRLVWAGGEIAVATTVKGPDGAILLLPAEPAPLPLPGTPVMQHLDWDRRHRLMRMHTALHLLSVVMPYPVTGGSIGAEHGRLDFDLAEAPGDRDAIEDALNAMVARNLPVSAEWIDEAALDADPGLVKTLRVAPPRGAGRVRLIRIGWADQTVDLQPCGGTHVEGTGEIGPLRLGKIEKKGRENRRVYLHLAD